MNLFILSDNATSAAIYQCDIHIRKMIVETAQMLSTNHRYLDGKMFIELSKSGRRIKKWDHPTYDSLLYKSTHVNHPSTIWIRESAANYNWAYTHFVALCHEYKWRFGKDHATYTKLHHVLSQPPKNISRNGLTPFAIAINHDIYGLSHVKDPVDAYRQYYVKKHQEQFSMKWSKNSTPDWFLEINSRHAA